MYYSEQIGLEKTDARRWKLRTTELGAQRWEYTQQPEQQSDVEKFLLNEDTFDRTPLPRPNTVEDALDNAGQFFSRIQDENSGTWPNQYKGPMFMTIGYVAVSQFTKTPIPEPVRVELIRYLVNTAHPVDGGWGLHEVDKSTCFGTTINYVILRLLGLEPDHPVLAKARATLHRLGGAIGVPHWGKAWLSLLRLYEWEGVNPAPTELFALPYSLPVHPMRWWVHTRAIYLPLGYLACKRVQCEDSPLLKQIRAEIYTKPYGNITFSQHRNTVCGVDLYYPHTSLLNVANWLMVQYEKHVRPAWLLRYANKKAYEQILKELENTEYLAIAPVSGAFNVLVLFLEEGPDSPRYKRAFDRMNEELFLGPMGMTVMGTNGSQAWDASFAIQSLFVAGLAEKPEYHDVVSRAFKFLVRSQFDTECVEGSFRDKRVGGWPFSTKEQGYIVCDCTAEAAKAVIMVLHSDAFKDIHRLYDEAKLQPSVDRLLELQNVGLRKIGSFDYGSFCSYEQNKATTLLELLNPAEVFGNIMVEYPYVECTDSSVLGLVYYKRHYGYRSQEIATAVERALGYLARQQNEDGSWYGCWGICYTYSGMFALEAFSEAEQFYHNNENVRKGCDFLCSRQLPDGGWGESMKSSETHSYVSTKESLVVQTSWALIGLILAQYPDRKVIERGVQLLLSRQQPSGEWLFESVEGVFNHSCAIEYPNYKFMFPMKALGLFLKSKTES